MTGRLIAASIVLACLAGCAHKTAPQAAARRGEGLPPVMRRQVLGAVDAGDGDLETKNLRAKVTADPNDLASRLALARRYEAAGYPELGVEHCRVAAERFPNSPEVPETLARMQRAMKMPAEAETAIGSYLSGAKPVTPSLYSWLGIVRDDQKKYAAAEQAHRRAVEMSPESDVFHNNLGNNLLYQGRKDEAAAEFRAALKINPKSEVARNNLGMAVASQPREAVLVWESGSDPATAHNNLAAVRMEQGNYQEARKELEIALGYNRNHPAALKNLSLITRTDGQPVDLRGNEDRGFWSRFAHLMGDAVLGKHEKYENGAARTASR